MVPSVTPEVDKFFNDELKQKMKEFAVLGTAAGVSTGLINGVQNEIMGTISPGAYVSPLLPKSNQVPNILAYDIPQ